MPRKLPAWFVTLSPVFTNSNFKKTGKRPAPFPRQPTTQPNLSAHQFVQDRAVRADQADVQWHLSDGMGRAAQAWIVTADAVFDTVEHRFGDVVAAPLMPRGLRRGLGY